MKQLLDKYRTLKSQKQFLKIILANVINRFGDSIDAIAFTWLVYQITHDASWSAIMIGVNILPTIFLQPLMGGVVERIKKQKIMVLCDIGRGIAVALIAILYIIGILNPWMLLVITIINSSLEALRVPAGIAIVPKLLDKECYDVGVSLNSSLSQVMQLIGTGCAGIVIAAFGITSAIFIDAITFFLSAIIIAWIHYKERIENAKLSMQSYLNTMKEGFQYVKKRDIIVLLCILGALLNMLAAPLNSLLPAFIDQVMHGNSATLSILSVSMTIGMMFGTFLYPLFSKFITGKLAFVGTMVSSGIFYVLIIFIPSLGLSPWILNIIIIILFIIFGVGIAIANTWISIFFMTYVDEDYMARCGAVFNASVCASVPIVSFTISGILKIISLSNILLLTGVLSIVIGLVLFSMKKIQEMDNEIKQ